MQLSQVQQKAVETIEGALLIFAGAGSGKTRVITQKIHYLLSTKRVSPENILAVTFTNKAAREMRERVASLIANEEIVRELTISTFHSLGLRIIKRNHAVIGYPSNFIIYSSYEQVELMKQVMSERGYSKEQFSPKMLVHAISSIKNNPDLLHLSSFLLRSPINVVAKKLYPFYVETMKTAGGVDFDDLLMLPLTIFNKRPDIKDKYAKQFQYIMVDEYQDTNPTQYRLIKELSSHHQNICVVGDDDQSIYSWRGAVVENILNFHKDFDNCTVIKLEQNYRSVSTIVEAAAKLIEQNGTRAEKKTFSSQIADVGEGISLRSFPDEQAEADFVSTTIFNSLQNYNSLGNIAVLVRANAQTRPFEMAFARRSIPYTVIGGQKFFENKESKDLLAYLQLLVNPSSEVSLRRIINYPTRGIGTTTQQKIYAEAAKRSVSVITLLAQNSLDAFSPKQQESLRAFSQLYQKVQKMVQNNTPPVQLISYLVDRINIRQEVAKSSENETVGAIRIDNIDSFISALSQHADENRGMQTSGIIIDFINSVALIQSGEEEKKFNGVSIITAHSSKGLEFDTVFLIGMYDGGLPNSRALKEGGVEEERRLCYVAMTRAKKRLFISYPHTVRVKGRIETTHPSRFLKEAEISGDTRFFSKNSIEEDKSALFEEMLKKLKEKKPR
ncbi:UvrD-helicase domain-containing protein [bacterium]|nr:UvrD-helicase domain-containing protein [bacterium]